MPTHLLRINEARARLNNRSRSGFYADIDAGLITPPVKTGARSVGWPEHELDAIVQGRIAGMSDEQLRELVTRLIEARKAHLHTYAVAVDSAISATGNLAQEIRELIGQLKTALRSLEA